MYLNEFDPLQRLLKITVAGDTTVEEIRSALEAGHQRGRLGIRAVAC